MWDNLSKEDLKNLQSLFDKGGIVGALSNEYMIFRCTTCGEQVNVDYKGGDPFVHYKGGDPFFIYSCSCGSQGSFKVSAQRVHHLPLRLLRSRFLNDLIPTFGIKARLGMSPEELILSYKEQQRDFEKKVNSEESKNDLRRRKQEKEGGNAPLWRISDEKFWDDSCPDQRYYTLGTSQLKIFGEETNVIFYFAANKLCAIFVALWKRIGQPEVFTEELEKLMIFLRKEHYVYLRPHVDYGNLAWDERNIYKWQESLGHSGLQLRVYFKEHRPDGFEIFLARKEFKNGPYIDG